MICTICKISLPERHSRYFREKVFFIVSYLIFQKIRSFALFVLKISSFSNAQLLINFYRVHLPSELGLNL